MEQFGIFISANWAGLLIVMGVSAIFGFLLSMSALGINRERRKKGYRRGKYTKYEKKLDRRLLQEYKEDPDMRIYLSDDMEHHSSKRFRSS